jgi:hypothetical protein
LLDNRNQPCEPPACTGQKSVRKQHGFERSVTIEKINETSIPRDELTAIEACFAALVDAALTQAKRGRDGVVENVRSFNVPEEKRATRTTG